ncbi:hypothetical protein A2313_03890 [Candidatus Roizmanbacteria bacterium RIFOXYB2_FULL_41_10]|uniref:Sortase n=1 Tax=Candidatus Roizmanbacteria bacterium RIFOXYA1_FULL_41_12 TaxID=1802082 RepID=A0A1F7K256_9BACT|nr:MAG: hypothetical protein A2209_00535 [Candidatus Roizmanbacteria bacterium RIFOXYA1_FULL_41_12]OGK66612.1 MAG: hypothetical protein A2377_00295 [Candidatus Roizmanbacteria bacterium RIFOXYB1_FULL_41_27]OGK69250.1 MAG: hypothetical protein A2313_03890 [Candidatus Roizmanbacteria bacterium RIFOXYB2_FULL_41_10]OGK71008.1 MAG: hypothetical protein A2403_03870 [Candidatus Roizmanbacteria bacterium RIFOXYC1_FULL_41_16]OGK74600.1 MAG: hypothetical protein A2575_00910 [Candidatus Roizmanbacteria ba
MPAVKSLKRNKLTRVLFIASLFFLIASFLILILTYQPVVLEELKYAIKRPQTQIVPQDKEFGIVIPKINANAKIVRDVDPYIASIYQPALAQGVAHAFGTGLPGEKANIFLFAHSSGNWYQANRYNSVFYLLYKLKPKDEIQVYFINSLFKYQVQSLEYVEPDRIDYLSRESAEETLTLMTCWPPGTTQKRLILKAKRIID